MTYVGPPVAIGLMGSMQRSGWSRPNPASLLAAKIAVAAGFVMLVPAVAFPTLVASHVIASTTLGCTGVTSEWQTHLLHQIDIYGRVLYVTLTYAALTALISLALNSRGWGTALTVVYFYLEYILFNLAIGWLDSLDWVFGLLPRLLTVHWTIPDSLGSMHNILGLEDTAWALLIMGLHTLWMSTAAYLLIRRRNRPPGVCAERHFRPVSPKG